MKKETLEIYKFEGLTIGYAHCGDNSPTEEDVMNKVMDFAKNKKVKIYKHFIRKEWVKNPKYKPAIIDERKYPKGDEIWYLDIYYQ